MRGQIRLFEAFSSCWRVSSMASAAREEAILAPRRTCPPGGPERILHPRGKWCPCGKVFAGGENTERAKGAARSNQALRAFSVAGGSAQWPLAARGDSI